MQRIEMYFDYECPFCLRAFEHILALQKEFPDLEIDLHPLVLRQEPGYTFRSRSALASQLFYYLKETATQEEQLNFTWQVYTLVHREGADIDDPEILAEKLSAFIPADKTREILEKGLYRDRQESANEAFDRYQIAYVPIFRLDGKQLNALGGEGITREELRQFIS